MNNWYVFMLLIVFGSCEYHSFSFNTCEVRDPVSDLPWLKNRIEEMQRDQSGIGKYFYIAEGSYNGQTVFIFGNCCWMCSTIVPVYNCDGVLLFYLNGTNSEKIGGYTLLWCPGDLVCTLKM